MAAKIMQGKKVRTTNGSGYCEKLDPDRNQSSITAQIFFTLWDQVNDQSFSGLISCINTVMKENSRGYYDRLIEFM